MAAEGLIKDLCDEATCSICLEYFKDPVTTECGHSFCRGCLTQDRGDSDAETSCPQCREAVQRRSLRPNRQLANFVEISKQLSRQGGKRAEEKGGVCGKHLEPFKLFCKDDEIPLCEECGRSKEHKYHEAVPLEEASQACKAEICSRVKILKKKKRREILAYKADAEKEIQDLLKQTKAEREKTTAEFRQLHQFLEVQEKLLVAQMEEVEKQILRQREERLAGLSKELSSLESLIWELEKKCQQPASELLQDARNILQRSEEETRVNPLVFPLELKWMIWGFSDIPSCLAAVMKQFKDALLSGLQLHKVNVTLDEDTANPQLILSKDCKSITHGGQCQPLPDSPARFDTYPAVLGCEGFTAGRHFWEVVVGSEKRWAVGVAGQSVRRKGSVPFCAEEGIWAVEKWEEGYRASNSILNYPPVTPRENPKRLRVSLNCAGGQVTLFDADTAALLYTFTEASFSGETLHPFFWLLGEKAHLRIP